MIVIERESSITRLTVTKKGIIIKVSRDIGKAEYDGVIQIARYIKSRLYPIKYTLRGVIGDDHSITLLDDSRSWGYVISKHGMDFNARYIQR